MTDNIYPDEDDAHDGGVLRPVLMAVFLVLVGLNLWIWDENQENREPSPALITVTHQK